MSRVATGESVIARAVRIVEAFGLDEPSLTIGEIARRAELHVATASRMVEELVRAGWLERSGREVRIGIRLWELSTRASPVMGLRAAALPFMEDLHQVIGNDTQLAVLEGTEVLFLERLWSPGPVVNYSRIAGRLPVHASSSGLVLLAHAAHDVQQSVMDSPMKVYTDQTIQTGAELRAMLAHIRREGYALCAGHIYPDTTGIAAPVRDGRGTVVAALGIIAPNDAASYSKIPAVQAAARGISRVMTHVRGPHQ
ncbi:IclR family transcriptional regulator [Gordonia sp. SL306]|uniref:IclR family transcriptional regulator n=1 Tax=Gordonia sp. SL306 TaxID=2995145 RepID=UPI00226D929B|nr:IclR family transcriptional regulator [Gordonia sp. SL306]WAC55488.1 IclR family transcriptional regulator [Gordonia sp. SL306]